MTSVHFAQPDVTLLLDVQGVIQKSALSSVFSGEGVDGWLGLPWAETVGDVGSERVRRMVEDARNSGVSASHEITQRFPSELELAIEYTTLRLGGNAGFIAIGRNLQTVEEIRAELIAAQQTMEQDYWKLREVETRYRLSFETSNEPVLLLSADDARVVESNAAALRALGLRAGQELLPGLAADERDRLRAMLDTTRAQGIAPSLAVSLGPDRQRWLVRFSLITSSSAQPLFLLRFAPVLVGKSPSNDDLVTAADLFERLPDGFVLLDQDGLILRANQPFRDLIEVTAQDAVVGESLGRWLRHPGADMSALLANLHRDGAVGFFPTVISRASGTAVGVEISAAGSLAATQKFIGVLLKSRQSAADEHAPLRGLGPAVELIEKASLRKLISNTIADIERECIEAARVQTEADKAALEKSADDRKHPYGKLH
jgi:transcriptional regulator PpsR